MSNDKYRNYFHITDNIITNKKFLLYPKKLIYTIKNIADASCNF